MKKEAGLMTRWTVKTIPVWWWYMDPIDARWAVANNLLNRIGYCTLDGKCVKPEASNPPTPVINYDWYRSQNKCGDRCPCEQDGTCIRIRSITPKVIFDIGDTQKFAIVNTWVISDIGHRATDTVVRIRFDNVLVAAPGSMPTWDSINIMLYNLDQQGNIYVRYNPAFGHYMYYDFDVQDSQGNKIPARAITVVGYSPTPLLTSKIDLVAAMCCKPWATWYGALITISIRSSPILYAPMLTYNDWARSLRSYVAYSADGVHVVAGPVQAVVSILRNLNIDKWCIVDEHGNVVDYVGVDQEECLSAVSSASEPPVVDESLIPPI